MLILFQPNHGNRKNVCAPKIFALKKKPIKQELLRHEALVNLVFQLSRTPRATL